MIVSIIGSYNLILAFAMLLVLFRELDNTQRKYTVGIHMASMAIAVYCFK